MAPDQALSPIVDAATVEELIESFSTVGALVTAGKTPTLTVTDVVVVAKEKKNGPLGASWNREVAIAFGNLLRLLRLSGS